MRYTVKYNIRKTRKSDLSVQTILTNSLSSETFNAYFELECSMANQDRLVAETLARKNDLESYIYEIRDRVEFELVDYIQPGDKDKFLSKLSEVITIYSLDSLVLDRRMALWRRVVCSEKSIYFVTTGSSCCWRCRDFSSFRRISSRGSCPGI